MTPSGRGMVVGDLFCGQGGASAGYVRAGFRVFGVDAADQPLYPWDFVRDDALVARQDFQYQVHAWHASPPCTDHTVLQGRATVNPHGTFDLLEATIESLRSQSRPWVVENVVSPSTRAIMKGAVVACGRALGIPRLARHRLFLASFPLTMPPCACDGSDGRALGVYGDLRHTPRAAGLRAVKATIGQARAMFDTPWMDARGLAQAIPARYTEHVGRQLAAHLVTAGGIRS